MFRIACPVLVLSALPALAHEGMHHHPHGIEYGWIIAALAGLVGGFALARLRGRK
jgi:hypothetical protein